MGECMTTTKTLSSYLALPWTYHVETAQSAETIVFIIKVNELPEVMATGVSLEAAMAALRGELKDALIRRLQLGELVPEPLNPEQFKGKVAYRTTPERHYMLAKEAKRRGMSLSRLIDYCLDEKL